MAGRIPQQFIDDLVARTDVVDVVDDYVPLKRAGRDFMARCPFHEEKTPSFTVSREKQFYHCFGCGAHGTAIGFLMDHARMSFVEAVEELATRAGIQVPREGGEAHPASDDTGLHELLTDAAAYYRQQLREHPQAGRAVSYLKGRGLSGQIAADFGMGFAPPGWDNLIQHLGGAQDRVRALARAGLIIEGDGGKRYDRFRDRIMFPILDRRGRTVGFGGRVLDDSTPKYLNSPETAVFHKGREVYGLYQAREHSRELARILVVEGYMDVVALAQFGIRNAVATLGTAITAEHLGQLFRATPQVLFCFDGDAAGRRAAWRAVEQSLPLMRDGRQAAFMFLPEGEDPDTLVRKAGPDGFARETERATPLSKFLFEHLQEVNRGSLDGQARLVEHSRPLLDKLPEGAFRELMVQRLAELAGMDTGNLTTLLRGKRPAAAGFRRESRTAHHPPSLVRKTVTLLLHDPALAQSVDDVRWLESVRLPGAQVLSELFDLLRTNPHMNMAGMLEHFRGSETGKHLGKLAVLEDPSSYGADPQQEFRDAMAKLRAKQREERFEELQHKARTGVLVEAERREYAALIHRSGQADEAEH
jgi:DNA primase